jgi:putative transposase
VHYDTTNSKVSILDNLTARITYSIKLISELITEETEIDRKTIRKLVKESDILHSDWEDKLKRANTRLESARDDKEKDKAEKSLQKLLKREPSIPSFEDKTPCRIDSRTGHIEWGKDKFSHVWLHVSTHIKNKIVELR